MVSDALFLATETIEFVGKKPQNLSVGFVAYTRNSPLPDAFEQEFSACCAIKYCVGVGNGLEALRLILHAYAIGDGDEVIVPLNIYIATWLAVSYAGAKPVPVESDIITYNLDPELVEAAITPKTRAILPVHLYGMPADMDPLLKLAARLTEMMGVLTCKDIYVNAKIELSPKS